jgi:hypothetical protein
MTQNYAKSLIKLVPKWIQYSVLHRDETIIYVYPTPDNIEKVEYIDKAQNCFKFKATTVKCDSNSKDIPIQSSPKEEEPHII